MARSAVNINNITYHFKFNYSEIKDLQAEQFVTSPAFHALGHEWVIDCYPRGSRNNWPFHRIAFMVRLLGGCINVNPTISCSLIKRDGTKCTPKYPCKRTDTGSVLQRAVEKSPFQNHIYYYGCRFIPSLEDFVNDGSFELLCSIDNMDAPSIRCRPPAPNSFALHSQIGNLLESSESTYVTFDVENRSFMCHRLILAARSPVFKAELFGSMAEATQQHIKIKDVCPEVFEAMLHFIYTDSLTCCDSEKASMKMAHHLFVVSDRYEIGGLKALCEDKLCASISLDTVGSILALAEQHNSSRLKSGCMEFIAKSEPGNLVSWMLTDEYVDLMRSIPTVLAEIRAKVNT